MAIPKKRNRPELTVMEAVDNLSSMAELDELSWRKREEEIAPEEEVGHAVRWVNPKNQEKNKEVVKETFRVIHNYLNHIYEREQSELEDQKTQRGIQAIMVLAGEAAQKMGKFTHLFKEKHGEKEELQIKEYRDLQHFYLTKIVQRFQEKLEAEESWQKEFGALEGDLDIERRGLKDLEMVRKDKRYELFYIQKEDGRPFFNRNLLRHIRLVGEFDEILATVEREDPLVRTRGVQDREMQAAAEDIVKRSALALEDFYREGGMRHKDRELISNLNRAVMALMLAANPRNLIAHTAVKSCLSYFADFHLFLRKVLICPEYFEMIAYPSQENNRLTKAAMTLCEVLSAGFFTRWGRKGEAIALIRRLSKAKTPESSDKMPARSFWSAILEENEQMQDELKRFPNGPLLKTLDVFREELENQGFDPFLMGNYPAQLFRSLSKELDMSVIRLPSPTRQTMIHKAEVVEEFESFLRFLAKGKRCLVIQLQDRTSWYEHARADVLEKLQRKAEFAETLTVVTLAKNTDFYFQTDAYYELSSAELFLENFFQQIESGESCGFYFPPLLQTKEVKEFCKELLRKIHQQFFQAKETLTRKNRLDFIELFYLFFTMKLIELIRPDVLSFSCKDGIDTTAAASAAFYAFLRELTTLSPWTKEEREYLLWMIYSSALIVRERLIDPQRLSRFVSALSTFQVEFEANREKILDSFKELYSTRPWEGMELYTS